MQHALLLTTMLLATALPLVHACAAHSFPACSQVVPLRGDSIQQDEAQVLCSSGSADSAVSTVEQHTHTESAGTEISTDAESDAEVHMLEGDIPDCSSRACSPSGQCTCNGHVCVCHAAAHSFSVACTWS